MIGQTTFGSSAGLSNPLSLTSGSERSWLGPVRGAPLALTAGTGLAAAALLAPQTALAGEPAATENHFASVNPDLSDLTQQSVGDYRKGFGDQNFDLFAPLKSRYELLDTAYDVYNTMVPASLEAEKPTGLSQNIQENALGSLGVALAVYTIFNEYRKRPLMHGNEELNGALKGMAYYVAIQSAARLGTDVINDCLRHGEFALHAEHINWDLVFSGWTTWGATGWIWQIVAMLAFPLSSPWVRGFLASTTRKGDFILSGGKYLAAKSGTVADLLAANPKNGMTFKIDAEQLSGPNSSGQVEEVIKLIESFDAESKSSTAFSAKFSFGAERYAMVREGLKNLTKDSDARIIVKVEYPINLKNETVTEGTLLSGSVIEIDGKPVTLKVKKPITDPVRVIKGTVMYTSSVDFYGEKQLSKEIVSEGILRRGSIVKTDDKKRQLEDDELITQPVEVIEGTVIHKSELSWDKPQVRKKFNNANFTIEVKGSARAVLQELPNLIATRSVTTFTAKPLSLLPGSARKSLRRVFKPTALDVTIKAPFTDTTATLQNPIAGLASQKRVISDLPENPTVQFTLAQLEFQAEREKQTEVMLGFNRKAFEEAFGIDLRHGKAFDLTVQLPGFSGEQKARLVGKRVYVTVNAKEAIAAAKNEKIYNELANSRVGLPGLSEKKLVIVLPNPTVDATMVWKIAEAEKLDAKVSAGSLRTLAEVEGHDPSWMESAAFFAKSAVPTFRFGRPRSLAARTMSTFFMSAAIVFSLKQVQGFSPDVAAVSSLRTIFSGAINSALAPGIVSVVGESGYSGFKYYIGSVTYLTIFEFINELKESDLLLFEEKVREIKREDRVAEREYLARDMQQIEADTYRTRPHLREDFIKVRLANLISTGVTTPEDARLVLEIYRDGKDSKPHFNEHFLAALLLDDGLKGAVSADPEAKAYFAGEIAAQSGAIDQAFAYLGVERPADFSTAF